LSGVLSIIFGVLVAAQPNSGAFALFLFGLYAILAGTSRIVLGFRLRGLGEDVRKASMQTVSSALH